MELILHIIFVTSNHFLFDLNMQTLDSKLYVYISPEFKNICDGKPKRKLGTHKPSEKQIMLL